ncbi:helix-turn-helix domain-containing protein [Parasphingorhabdus sp.]|uniref:TetR/AcrR family transcriptional regulator n=1 Tax=Parasphingorhabdus sp. TaxID=2709688 RepID=UPI003296CB87
MARAANYDRETALDAAMTQFWRKGYHATSLKDLELGLDMKPGSIYAAFESKENLYLLSIERYFNASRRGFRAHLDQADSPLAGLAAHFHSFTELSSDDRSRQACMLTKTLVDTKTTDPKIATATQRYLDAMCAEFALGFEAARAAGQISKEAVPDRLARRHQANITALRVELHRGSSQQVIDALADDMAQEVLNLAI